MWLSDLEWDDLVESPEGDLYCQTSVTFFKKMEFELA